MLNIIVTVDNNIPNTKVETIFAGFRFSLLMKSLE